ncbi:MAG: hypothetical protein HJJLKODD_01135 [Phycisphaerae bacterium]|nr:hypothetical protein [Phycisphaerae bacterium]
MSAESHPSSWLLLSVAEFLDRTGQRSPTPGGGTVAAVTAGLAAALARMVTAYSFPAKPTGTEAPELLDLAEQLQRLDGAIRRLADEDAAAYEQMQKMQRQVRQQEATAAELQQAVELAITVPMELLALIGYLLQLMADRAGLLNKRLRSDGAVVAHLGRAAGRAARENVLINIYEVASGEERTRYYDQADLLLQKAEEQADRLLQNLG